MPHPKTLAEVMSELRENPENNASQDNAFEYLQEKERGTASAEAQIAQEVLNLMRENPTFHKELTDKLEEPDRSKYEKAHLDELATAANRSGMDKLLHDFMGKKKKAAQTELKQLAENVFSKNAEEINEAAIGPESVRRDEEKCKYPDDFEPIEHTYNAENGNKVELKGAKYVPEHPTGKVVLVFTGSGMPAASQIGNIKDAYLEAGATVISLDYRGFGKSQEYDKEGNVVKTLPNEQTLNQDARAMYDYVLKSVPGVKPSDVILHGYSMGGPVAAKVAADIAAEHTEKGAAVKEEHRLGGLTLHSPVASSYEAALNVYGRDRMESFKSWLFGGGHNTRAHMRQLHSNDPELPVHYIGGGSGDWLSLESTRIDRDPKAKFVNSSTYKGDKGHLDKNVSSDDPGLREMAQKGRGAKLTLEPVKTQKPVERAAGKT